MLEIDNRQNRVEVNNVLLELIKNSIGFALNYMGFKREWDINLIITDNEDIREINREFRNIDRETDVLSFPMLKFEDVYNGRDEFLIDEINPENGNVILGDIVISAEKAVEQASIYGHSVNREFSFLIVHSILHLLGYDHIDEEDRIIMRKYEEEILSKLNMTR